MLIAFEGLDQSGKETQARHLRARLEQEGRKVRTLSFPEYETPIGRELRHALSGEREYTPEVMQLLYVANRFEMKPRLDLWLAAGDVIICDRYTASSVVYGEAQGLDRPWLEEIQRHLPKPALTLLLDITPATAAQRKKANRDRYERDMDLLARVRDSYKRYAGTRSDWMVIDAERSRDDVAAAVAQAVARAFARRSARARS